VTHANTYTKKIFYHVDRLAESHGPKIGYAFCLQALDELKSLQEELGDIPQVKSEISGAIENLAVRSSDFFLQVCDGEDGNTGAPFRLH
jgi:hypothetical protein